MNHVKRIGLKAFSLIGLDGTQWIVPPSFIIVVDCECDSLCQRSNAGLRCILCPGKAQIQEPTTTLRIPVTWCPEYRSRFEGLY